MYQVKTYARHDHDEDSPTFTEFGTCETFTDEQAALTSASLTATNDYTCRMVGAKFDGFAVVVFRDNEPEACIEHDGIRLVSWHGDEISDDFRK